MIYLLIALLFWPFQALAWTHGSPGGRSIPVVSSVSPNVAPTAGGTSIAVGGSGYTGVVGASGVKFVTNPGNVATNAASYVVNSDGSITAVSPAGSTGLNDIVVTNAVGSSTKNSGDRFTYGVALALTSVLPSNGSLAGTTFVTISGNGLTGTTCSNVTFGGTTATNCTVVNDTTLTAQTPAGTAGAVDVVVTNSNGTATLTAAYTYQGLSAPAVAGATDPNGVTLYGSETRQMVAHIIPNGDCMQPGTSGGGAGCSFHNVACAIVAGCPVVFVGTGVWADSVCAGNPQLDILSSSLGNVYVDLNTIPNEGPCTGNFNVINELINATMTYDNTGAAFGTPVDVVVADGPKGGDFVIRNDNTGEWPSPGLSGSGGAIRAASEYDDNSNSTHRSYLLLGTDGAGVRNGNPHNITFKGWGTGGCVGAACWVDGVDEAFVPSGTSHPACTTGQEGFTACTNLQGQFPVGTVLPSVGLRFMSIVKCPISNVGDPVVYAAFLSVGVQIWKRNDNDASSTWSLFSEVTNQADLNGTNGSASNGFRGMTCVATPFTVAHPSGYVLQTTLQVSSVLYRWDTQTGCLSACPAGIVNLGTVLHTAWTVGKTQISPYNGNEMFLYTDPASGNSWEVWGEGNSYGNPGTRTYVSAGNGTNPSGLSGLWWQSPSTPGSPTIYPPTPGTTASPPAFLNPAVGGVRKAFANGANTICHNAPSPGNPCAAQVSTRTQICSPFAEDGATSANGYCGQVIFMGGVDMQGTTVLGAVWTNTAWMLRLPVDSTVHP